MSTENTEKFEVRTLVLKRWDASKTKPLFGENCYQRGQFVSFQSYHFIDVLRSEDQDALLGTYNNIREPDYARLSDSHFDINKNERNVPDVHVVQSIPLLGKKGTFWDTDTEILYITLIQLSDSSKWKYDAIEQEIASFFSSVNKMNAQSEFITENNWSLYYSLDYCDYVLFSKNIKFDILNDLLWEMGLKRTNEFIAVRDTFTICSFGWTYLQRAFDQIKESKPVVWNDEMALNMNFCLRNISAVNSIMTALHGIDEGAIKITDHRLPGRYDWAISTNTLTGGQVLEVLYLINSILAQQSQCEGGDVYCRQYNFRDDMEPSISEYQVSMLSTSPVHAIGRPPYHSEFDQYATAIIDKLYGMFFKTDVEVPLHFSKASYVDYARETLRSLYELANSEFSEEFVLSVLPSLIAFLKIVDQKQRFLSEEDDPGYQEEIHSSCAKLQKKYFTALNTLSLCTMHSERQFIHSPAFNATFFNIPPKLLAYYNAVVFLIANRLKDSKLEQPSYTYVITPDYRTDIHVEPLNISYKKDTENHLAIINLPEKFFYQPRKAFMLFAHEVGHYEGYRNRELRACSIFYLVGVWILRCSPLACCLNEERGYINNHNLIGLFADAFGNYLKMQYDLQHVTGDRGIRYLLTDIVDFLKSYDYGLGIFCDDMSRQSIIKAWVDALRNASLDMTLQNEITELMRQLSDRDGTDYYCRLSKDPQCIGVCELIARTIASHCEGVKTEETLSCQFITNKCEDTVSLFSEAYADMQMLEVLGYDMFNLDDYCNTLEEIKEGGISGKVSNLNEEYIVAQHLLRYSVLKRQLTVNCESLTNVFQETEVRCVLNYLEQCKAIYNTEKTIATNVQDVLAPVFNKRINRKQWCESLCTVLKDYESRIRSMYKAEDNII